MNLESSIIPRSTFHQPSIFDVIFFIEIRKERIDGWLSTKLIVPRCLHVLFRCGKVFYLNLKFHSLSSFERCCNDCAALVAQIQTFEEAHGLLYLVYLLLSLVSCCLRTWHDVIVWALTGAWRSLALQPTLHCGIISNWILPLPELAFNRIEIQNGSARYCINRVLWVADRHHTWLLRSRGLLFLFYFSSLWYEFQSIERLVARSTALILS